MTQNTCVAMFAPFLPVGTRMFSVCVIYCIYLDTYSDTNLLWGCNCGLVPTACRLVVLLCIGVLSPALWSCTFSTISVDLTLKLLCFKWSCILWPLPVYLFICVDVSKIRSFCKKWFHLCAMFVSPLVTCKTPRWLFKAILSLWMWGHVTKLRAITHEKHGDRRICSCKIHSWYRLEISFLEGKLCRIPR